MANDLFMQIKLLVSGDGGAEIRRLQGRLGELRQQLNQLQNVKLAGLSSELATLRNNLASARAINLGDLPANLAKAKAELLSSSNAGANLRLAMQGFANTNKEIRELNISPLQRQIQGIKQSLADTRLITLTPLQNSLRSAQNDVLGTQVKIRSLRQELAQLRSTGASEIQIRSKQGEIAGAINDLEGYRSAVDKARIAVNSKQNTLASLSARLQRSTAALRSQVASYESLVDANKRSVAQLNSQLQAEKQREIAARNTIGLTRAQIQAEVDGAKQRQAVIQQQITAKQQEIISAKQGISAQKEQISNTRSLLAQQKLLTGTSGELSRLNTIAKEFSSSFGFMFGPQMAGLAAAASISGLISAFVEVNKQVENLIRGLNAISGGSGVSEFNYLVGVSNRLGLAIHDTANSFLQIEATTAGTNFAGEQTRHIFESLSRALNVTGADSVTFNRAFRAVSQMLSKGQLYAEELKGQLAEALPGAIQVFAKALEVTPKKFLAMVKAGEIEGQILYDVLSLVANQLDKTYKVANESDFTFTQKAALAKNAFSLLLIELGKSGIWKAAGDGMLFLRDMMVNLTKDISPALSIINANFNEIASSVKQGIDSLRSSGFGVDDVEFNFSGLVRNFRFALQLLPREVDSIIPDLERSLSEFTFTKAISEFSANIKALVEIIASAAGSFSADASENPFSKQLSTLQTRAESLSAKLIKLNALKLNGPIDAGRLKQLNDEYESVKNSRDLVESYKNTWDSLNKTGQMRFVDDKSVIDIATVRQEIESTKDQLDSLKGSRSRINLSGLFTGDIVGESETKIAAIDEQIKTLQAHLDKLTTRESNIKLNINSAQLRSAESDADNLAASIGDALNKRAETVGIQKNQRDSIYYLQESNRLEEMKIGYYHEQTTAYGKYKAEANKDKELAVTKQQLQSTKALLAADKERDTALRSIRDKAIDRRVKEGLITSTEAESEKERNAWFDAYNAINKAKSAVADYNSEKTKETDDGNQENRIKLKREEAIEQIKLAQNLAQQNGDEYQYNQLYAQRVQLIQDEYANQKKISDLVYKAKLKAFGDVKKDVSDVKKEYQDEIDKNPLSMSVELKQSTVIPETTADTSGFLNASLNEAQTPSIKIQQHRIVVDDKELSSALAELNQYQDKIRDIRTIALAGGKTEILISTGVNQPALQQALGFIKTSAEQTQPQVPVSPKIEPAAVAATQKTISDILSAKNEAGQPINFIMRSNAKTELRSIQDNLNTTFGKDKYKATIVSTVVGGDTTSDGWIKNQEMKRTLVITPNLNMNDAQNKITQTEKAIKDGMISATSIAPQSIQDVLNKSFGDGKYSIRITPKIISGETTEDGWIKSTEVKRVLTIEPKLNEASWQGLRELDEKQKQDLVKPVALNTADALTQDAELVSKLSQEVTKTVRLIYSSGGGDNWNPDVTASTGGFISGYGGGDRIRALLEPGEFVLRKEAVKKLGLERIMALNTMNGMPRIPTVDRFDIPQFASGGLVGQTVNLNINVGGKAYALSGAREHVIGFADALTRVARTL